MSKRILLMFLYCRVLGNFQVLSAGPATPARWRVKPVGSGGVNNHSETRSDGDEGRGEPQWSCRAKEMPDSRTLGWTFTLDARNRYKNSLKPHTASLLFWINTLLQSWALEVEKLVSREVGLSFCLGRLNYMSNTENGRDGHETVTLLYLSYVGRLPQSSQKCGRSGARLLLLCRSHRCRWGLAAGSL